MKELGVHMNIYFNIFYDALIVRNPPWASPTRVCPEFFYYISIGETNIVLYINFRSIE